MTKHEAQANVKEFRTQYSVTASAWYRLADIVKYVVENPGVTDTFNGLKFFVRGDYLYFQLHSGRCLLYYMPKVELIRTPWGEMKWQPTFLGLNAKSVWCRQVLTPSKIIENLVQASARDLLVYSQHTLYLAEFNILLNVHDEILTSQRPDFMSLEHFIETMIEKPFWTNKLKRPLPLNADGWIGNRYRK